MITMTDPRTMPEEQLTSTQQTALSSLILGNTVSEAAGEAGVHRNTVHRWLKNDEPFQAAKHRAQRDARASVEAKLHDTAMAAVDCIEKCLLEGDAYVARQLLKGLGCLDGKLKNLGSEDAVTLAREALRGSEIAEILGGDRGARSKIGGRKSAPADGDWVDDDSVSANLQPSATSDETVDSQAARQPDAAPDLSEMERYASVFEASENPQPSATSHEDRSTPPPLAPTSDLRSPTSNVQHTATSVDGYANLTPQQTTAMLALQTGQSVEEAADTADTEPATVHQWIRGDSTFQAAMNRCAGERRRAIHARLDQLASLAAEVVHHKITQGNGHLAVGLLKGLGYLQGRT